MAGPTNSSSLSDAIMGLKLGKAFKDIGAVAGQPQRALVRLDLELVEETR